MTDATNPAPQTSHSVPPAPPAAPSAGAYPPPAAPQPQYAPPAYPPAYGYGQPASYGYAPARPTNVLAIISLIASVAGLTFVPFFGSIAGAIMGHISLKQLKSSGENGRGLALAGTIVGWVGVGIWALIIVFWVVWAVVFAGILASTGPTIGS